MDLSHLQAQLSHLPEKIVGGIWLGIALFLLGFALLTPSYILMLGGVARLLRHASPVGKLKGLAALGALVLTPFVVVGGTIWLQFLQE